ncbi:isoleucine--tRNA ligase [Candidatus Woesearchaeota archaeon]|nr:isoleucine--tRNA ligase [Candidatus Woesearchaeota archaeon]
MKFTTYNHTELEPQILAYWKHHKTLEKLRTKTQDGPKFYFLDGPPYTSGHIHLGHAWNMGLKDMMVRYKRMRGHNVWDRAGYDMHGLPTEQKVMVKFNLKDKQDIEQFGIAKFMEECEKFCTEMMLKMNDDFIRIGSTLDFSNPYQPIKQEFMEAEWLLIKKAQEKNRLYQGLRTMHWDTATQTAVAKHELEYKQITDISLYVKFPLVGKDKMYLVIWTTTPWTVPLNLAVMVHPEIEYCEVSVGTETWIVAKNRVDEVMTKAKVRQFRVTKTVKGKELEGLHYTHPLGVEKYLPLELQKNKRLFSVLLTEEYVDDSAGTGLVHCAPGCGPEDYEVGHLYHLPPFNCVNEGGIFENFGPLNGLKAKTDDSKFIELLDTTKAIVAKEKYTHEYPHGERSHQPVIFRTTKQWFFKVEDLKDKMVTANEQVLWQPQSAKNAFRSWLEFLRDNSITKQRYWGTPVPIWQAPDGDFIVVGSVAELESLSGQKVKGMHIPKIDDITITKNGKVYKRIPDVLDVWIDAGTASWNCLDYPVRTDLFEKYFPVDFILEGKDQIRGWYNLLVVASFLAFDIQPFKNVVMHGFLNDVSGVKMSKSLGNIISPDELVEKYGADGLRYYMCQTNAGEDVNFSWDECAVKSRQLNILWNVHKFLITHCEDNKINPFTLDKGITENVLGEEEKYIFSRLHSTIKEVTRLLEEYRIDEVIAHLDGLFLDLSRTYIQMVREKSAVGDDQDKEVVAYTVAHVMLETLKMFQIVAPFICEAMYLNFKQAFNLEPESISHFNWPVVDENKISRRLELDMATVQGVIQAALGAREKAKTGVRWPLKEVLISSKDPDTLEAVERLRDIVLKQVNAKGITVVENIPGVSVKVKPNYAAIGPAYGQLAPQIITKLTIDSPQTIVKHLESEGAYRFVLEGKEVEITKEMLVMEKVIPTHLQEGAFKNGFAYVNTHVDPELESEGFARELMRNVQSMRKKAGLQKRDDIHLFVLVSAEMRKRLARFEVDVREKVGAAKLEYVSAKAVKNHLAHEDFKVKNEEFSVWFDKA